MNEPIKLNEKNRVYTFVGGDKVILERVEELIVSSSGNHRIKANGKLHIIPPTWIHIEINDSEWTI